MITTFDLSSVTDRFIRYLDDAVAAWPGWVDNGGSVARFTIHNSPLMPEAVRSGGDCQVSFYLIHAQPEPSVRSTPLTGKAAQPNQRQPLGLTLFYLLTAFAKGSATHEQQAMSIAIKALHERATFNDPVDKFSCTITLDVEKGEESNRRWQSFSTSFRLSLVYRIGTIFLTPAAQPPAPSPPPNRIGLSLAPVALPFSGAGALAATASSVDLTPLNPRPTDIIHYDYTPALVRPGDRFAVFGSGLDRSTSKRLYLLDPVMTETEVTSWKGAPALQSESRLVAALPANVGAMPANAPEPGIYQLRVGSATASGDVGDYRSNATPISIAAQTDAPPTPWPGPPFEIAGAGFVVGATELYLDVSPLAEVAGPPAAGQFAIGGGGTSIRFVPPASLPTGNYYVRLRVRGVEGPAVGRIVVP